LQEFHNEIVFYQKTSEYRQYATKDGMTGLFNRHAYEETLEQLRRIPLNPNLSVMLLDLNNLKKTNDRFGHQAGDELIIVASILFSDVLKGLGDVYRIGGDEFIAILNQGDPTALVVSLKDKLAKHKLPDGSPATVAIGYALATDPASVSIDAMIKLADTRMYNDKQQYH